MPNESNTWVGVITGEDDRDTFQKITSKQYIQANYGWACFEATPFLNALGVEAMGVAAMDNEDNFGLAMARSMKGSQEGKLIRFDSGVRSISGDIFATPGTSTFVGRMDSFTPVLVEGGDSWIYSWHRLIASEFIPDVDVQDNTNGYHDIKKLKMERMKQDIVRDFSLSILGNSSGPNNGTMGPTSNNTDLPNLISVTQTTGTSIGGIDRAASVDGGTTYYWKNGFKAITSLGGGGPMDRPITYRRSMLKGMNDQRKFAESKMRYLLVATQGAWQTYDRLAYADTVESGGAGVVFGLNKKYDAAGIQHRTFDTHPMVWDTNLTIPTGAGTNTEAIYGIHLPSYAISFRKEETFYQEPWESPRTHDQFRTLNTQNRTRFTPMVTARRPHTVFYNIPQNTD